MADALYYDAKIRSVQQWRLLHAMAEGTRPIALRPEYSGGISQLQKIFAAPLREGVGTAISSDLIGIDTLKPLTRLGRIERPLIIPREIADHCKKLWAPKREIEFSFIGLSHWGRARTLSDWHLRNFHSVPSIPTLGPRENMANRLSEALSRGNRIAIFFSERGRAFPMKVWDEDYHAMLGNTVFSLCPDGDQIWSYRFFESILCGAIPVIQSNWPCYEGFKFFTLNQPVGELSYRPEDAAANFELCVARLTVSKKDLDGELANA